MAALLHIVEIEIEPIRRDYCVARVLVQNVGNRIITPGTLVARQSVGEGCGRPVEFFHSVSIAPGDQTRLSQLLSGSLKSLEFKHYRETDGEIIAVTGLIRRTVLSFTEAGETFFKDFLVPVYQSVAFRIQQVPIRKPSVKSRSGSHEAA